MNKLCLQDVIILITVVVLGTIVFVGYNIECPF